MEELVRTNPALQLTIAAQLAGRTPNPMPPPHNHSPPPYRTLRNSCHYGQQPNPRKHENFAGIHSLSLPTLPLQFIMVAKPDYTRSRGSRIKTARLTAIVETGLQESMATTSFSCIHAMPESKSDDRTAATSRGRISSPTPGAPDVAVQRRQPGLTPEQSKISDDNAQMKALGVSLKLVPKIISFF